MGRPLNNQQAADYTSLPISTLNRWRQEGKGPRFGKLGRRVFYRQEDLDAWLDEQFASAGNDPTAA